MQGLAHLPGRLPAETRAVIPLLGGFVFITCRRAPLKEALGLKDGMENYAAMMVGFPKFKYHRMPTRNEPVVQWV